MNAQNYTVLIVEDHPMITSGYKFAFQQVANELSAKFTIREANSFESAHRELSKLNEQHPLDILTLDLKLKPAEALNLLTGEDFAELAKNKFPKAKLIIATMFDNNYRIHSIFKHINPEGFLVKSDLTPGIMINCIKEVLLDAPYYSRTIVKSLRKYVSSDMLLDNLDRQILYHLSLGTLTKNLTHTLPLATASIEKRKKHLKEIFEATNDKELIRKAKNLGFV